MSETSNQATIKVQHKDDLRRFSFPRNGSFLELEKVLRNIFSLSPSFPLLVKYQDDEKDWVTCSSNAELAAAFDFTPNGILKLVIPFEAAPVKVESAPAPVSNVNVAEPVFSVPVASATAPVALQPGVCPWKACKEENKKNWREQKKNWTEQKKCMWKNWTPEERAAWMQKKESWRNRCQEEKQKMRGEHDQWKCDRKGWKKDWKEQRKLWKAQAQAQAVGGGGCCATPSSCSTTAPSAPPASGPLPSTFAPTANERFECGRGYGACPAKVWKARFVKHVTVPDDTAFPAGTYFIKTWRFRNESSETWPVGSKILCVGKNSDQMGGPKELEVGGVAEAGQELDVSVPLIAPHEPGCYVGFWRMADASGKRFGQRVRVQIQVQSPDTSSSSSSSSSDENERKAEVTTPAPLYPTIAPAPAVVEERSNPHTNVVAQLEAMGFKDRELMVKLARKHDGDIVKIVTKLMRRQRKDLMVDRR